MLEVSWVLSQDILRCFWSTLGYFSGSFGSCENFVWFSGDVLMNLLGLLECSGTHQGLIGDFPESFYRSSGAFLGLYISFPGPFL